MKRRENLKFFRNEELGFLVGITKNSKVSINGRDYTQVQNLEIPQEELIVHLKSFGRVEVLQKTFKNEVSRYYVIYGELNVTT